jgi:DNA-binding Xre family transcriptional regulator
MLPKEELIPIVDSAFDEVRARLRVANDTELARVLGTSQKTISELRNGHWTTIDAALISVLVTALRPIEQIA